MKRIISIAVGITLSLTALGFAYNEGQESVWERCVVEKNGIPVETCHELIR
jgi:hypothetical protein